MDLLFLTPFFIACIAFLFFIGIFATAFFLIFRGLRGKGASGRYNAYPQPSQFFDQTSPHREFEEPYRHHEHHGHQQQHHHSSGGGFGGSSGSESSGHSSHHHGGGFSDGGFSGGGHHGGHH